MEGRAYRHIGERVRAGSRAAKTCCVSHDLGELPPGRPGARAEVRQVARAARLARPAAGITPHHVASSKSFYEVIEGGAGKHVLEGLYAGRLREAGRVG